MAKEKIIEELEKIRIRLTEIYLNELGNPNNLEADSILSQDIEKIKRKYM